MGKNGAGSGKASGGRARTAGTDEIIANQKAVAAERMRTSAKATAAEKKAIAAGNKYVEDALQIESEIRTLRTEHSLTVYKLARAEEDLGKRDPETKALQKKADAQTAEIVRLTASAKSLRKKADAEYDRARNAR